MTDSIQRRKTGIAVFAGPTISGLNGELDKFAAFGVDVFPPSQRGDVATASARYHTLVIVDGLFHSVPAIGHVEIREAIAAGCVVYGCSSMGAIRAHEMRNMGMIGYGRVYELFAQFDDLTDDELAQLHGPGPAYTPLSEALVNIRVFLSGLVSEGTLRLAQAGAILDALGSKYFGHRTLASFRDELRHAGLLEPVVEVLIQRYVRCRAKTIDAIELMEKLTAIPPAPTGSVV